MITEYLDKAHAAFFENGTREIFNHYGLQHQLLTLLEELGELSQAAAMSLKGERPERAEELLCEELADVQIVIAQIMQAMPPDKRRLVVDMALFKVNRQLERIDEENAQGA